jgi:predicted ATP-dependent protease
VHEVIIPSSNARDLMLDEDVLEAVKRGRFTVRTVDTLEDAVEVLTGRHWSSKRDHMGVRDEVLQALQGLTEVQAIANRAPTPVVARPAALPKAARTHRRTR